MNIQDSITREEISHLGGGVELDLTDFGYEDEFLSAYQNYLGGGMRGAVANSCTVEDWEMDETLVQLASELRDYYNDRFYERSATRGSYRPNQANSNRKRRVFGLGYH